MNEIRRELASIISAVKTRIDLEKRFGVDTVTLSKSNKVISLPLPNAVPQIKPIEATVVTKPIGQQISLSEVGTSVCPPNDSIKISDDQTFMGEKERKIKLLEELRGEMLACHKCPLGKTRTNLVFGVGDPMAKLMFVGKRLDGTKIYKANHSSAGLANYSQRLLRLLVLNGAMCTLPTSLSAVRRATVILPEEIVLCMPYLIKQIETIQPKALCALVPLPLKPCSTQRLPVGTLRGNSTSIKGYL